MVWLGGGKGINEGKQIETMSELKIKCIVTDVSLYNKMWMNVTRDYTHIYYKQYHMIIVLNNY